MDLLKYYTGFYNGIKKTNELKNIDDRMFFITDLQTVLDFTDKIIEHVSNEDEVDNIMSEIANFPERFMPKENILIALLPPEKHRKDPPIVVSAHMTTEGKLLTAGGGYLHAINTTKESQSKLITASVTYVFMMLNSKSTEISYRETPFRTNSGREKIIPVVHFKNDKERIKYQYYLPRDPEWKHSWECIGHWRKVKSVGKDRNGEYNQLGRTWVNPCIKGDGELIKKIRVIKNSKQ